MPYVCMTCPRKQGLNWTIIDQFKVTKLSSKNVIHFQTVFLYMKRQPFSYVIHLMKICLIFWLPPDMLATLQFSYSIRYDLFHILFGIKPTSFFYTKAKTLYLLLKPSSKIRN